MEVGSQFNNCSSLILEQSKRANLISVVCSATSFLLLLLFLALLVLYRAYRTTLQRLFLYLTIATALDAMVTILNIELRFDVDPRLCGWIGFGDVWMSNLIELFNSAFTLYLISTAYQRFKGREMRCLGGCRRHPVLTETVSVFVIIIFPLSYLWVPAVHHTYGLGETVCWIKNYDQNCSEVNNSRTDVTILEVFDLSLHLIVILSFTTLIIILSMLVIKLRHSKEENLETVGRAIFMITMIAISTCIRVGQFGVNLGIQFFNVTINEYLYDSIDNPAYTISNLMVPLGFAVYLYSPRKLGIKSLKKAAKQWMCCRHCHSHRSETKKKRTKTDPQNSGIIDDDGLESIETSVEQDVPSHTTGYSSPYTNEFTDITEIVSSLECKSTPRYGSVNIQ